MLLPKFTISYVCNNAYLCKLKNMGSWCSSDVVDYFRTSLVNSYLNLENVF